MWPLLHPSIIGALVVTVMLPTYKIYCPHIRKWDNHHKYHCQASNMEFKVISYLYNLYGLYGRNKSFLQVFFKHFGWQLWIHFHQNMLCETELLYFCFCKQYLIFHIIHICKQYFIIRAKSFPLKEDSCYFKDFDLNKF